MMSYYEDDVDILLENDEIDVVEAAFLNGYSLGEI